MMATQEWNTPSGKKVTIRIVESPLQMGWAAAEIFRDKWHEKGDRRFVAGMPTGSTPIPFYNALIGMFLENEIDFRNVHTFNLDEYMDLPPYHPNSYRSYMENHLFRYVNLPKRNMHFLSGLTRDWRETCERYERSIRDQGGIDLQFLGVGVNGHIAFNEPGTEKTTRTRMVRLSERTLQDNVRVFSNPREAPQFALTMGIGTILESGMIVMLATGAGKANAVYESLCEPPTGRVPASFLQSFQGRCVFILDRPAAEELPLPGK
jgi:glucosamine-6-phosphate deaminase